MSTTSQSRIARTRLAAFIAFMILVFVHMDFLGAQATVIPGTTAVGASAAAVNVSVTSPKGGTISAVRLFGQGSANIDFVNNGGTCVPGASLLAGQSCSVSVVFKPASPGQRLGAVVLLDSNNHLLGQQLLSASATGSVGLFVPGLINTVAGTTTWIYNGDGLAGTVSAIFLPFGVAVDANGNIFIADSSNNRIRRIDVVSGNISTIAGNGITGTTGDNGPATSASLTNPTSVALDPAGNIYVADSGNYAIRRIDAFTGIITTVAGTLGTHGYSGDNGPATSATFNTPNGISFDANGNLYIADTGNNAIRMLSTNGKISTIAGNGTPGFQGDGGQASASLLNAPWSATPVPTGGYYIADQGNARVRLVSASGQISTVAGGVLGFSGDLGPASQAQLDAPASVALDVAGNVYIADSGNNRVRRINALTGVITTVAGTNSESISGDGGPANEAGLYGPYAIAIDTQGNLLIADVFHNRIRKVSANAAILNFPTMRVNRVSAPLTQVLENDGNAPFNIAQLDPFANSQIDAPTTTCSITTPLAVLGQCVIGVDFAPTTTGATVLGSVKVDSDAANTPGVITLSGQVLDVDPTTTTLTSSVNPSATGQTVKFTVNVTSTGGTPTGTITLLDGTTTIGSAALVSGSVTFSISNLTSGSHNLTASYPGDSQNASSVSAVLVQVVHDQLAATTTTLSSAASPTIAGDPATFTATVSVVTANSGSGNIGGTVNFMQGTTKLGSGTLNAATATSSTATVTTALTDLPVGTDSIVAVYVGSPNYATSTSSPLVQTVTLATSAISLTSAVSPSTAGKPLVLTATLTSNGGLPTGSVTFMDGTTSLGTAAINASGVAVLSAAGHFWTVGTHTLTAVYAGDADNSASTSTPISELINIASTTTTLTSSLNPAGLGATVKFTATVTTAGGAPTGTVEFFDNTNDLGPGTITATGASTGTASLSTSTLIIATHPITAVYSGDALDSTSTSAVLDQVINTATIAATLQSSATTVTYGAPLTLTAKVTGSGSTPTGTVALLDGTATVATQPVPANGIVLFVNPSLAIGSHTLTAAYSGDANHAAVTSAVVTQVVQQATTTALSTSASSITAGKSVTLTAVVTGVSAQPLTGNPAGTVKFLDAGALLATVTPDATGTATYTTSALTAGTHTISSVYSGDALDATSSSSTVSVVVTNATTTTTLATSANPINAGATLTLTSTVTGNGGTPTGTIAFHDGTTVLSSVALTSTGTATYATAALTPGIHNLYAVYSGDTFDATSTSPTTAEQVVEATAVTLTSSANPSLLQDNVTLTVSVGNGTASIPATGVVTITDGGVTLGTVMLNASGTGTYTFVSPALGTHTLVANYPGDNQNAPGSSNPLVQTVTLRPSTTTFTPSATSLSVGQNLTLISIVQASGSRPATGTVTFAAGSTVLGTATLDATGLATLTLTPAQGTFATVAQYSGDSLYAPSASTPATIVVGPTVEFNISLSPTNTMTLVSGQHGSMTVNITPAATFADTISLGCAGLPVDATCTFSKSQLKIGGGVLQTISVEVDTGDPLGAGANASNVQHNGISNTQLCALPVGAFLAFLLFFNRRRLNPKFALFALILIIGAGSTVLSGCASDLKINSTPAGSYTFQIVATGATTGATSNAAVQLTVTK